MYSAYITTLNGIRKHTNADRLQCCTVFGNNVIVDMSYHDGQRVIYFPVDGQLSEEFATDNNLVRVKNDDGSYSGGYLDPKKRNITALKLRGEKSDGLVMPIECLSKYTDISTLNDGDNITILNGHEICTKYIPNRNGGSRHNSVNGSKSKKKGLKTEFPTFLEHAETEQLAYYKLAFKEGDTCYITLKMHGTSARTANVKSVTRLNNGFFRRLFKLPVKTVSKYEVVTGTRRTICNSFGGGFYGSNAFREKYHKHLESILPKGLEVYYEIVGWINNEKTIMGIADNKRVKDKEFTKMYGDRTTFSYGCNVGENDAYVYRMTITNDDGFVIEVPWEQVQIYAEMLGMKCVPTFEKFIYTTFEDLMERVEKYYDGADPIGKTHIREGVVVRIDNRNKFTAFKHKNFYFKVLEGIIKDEATEPDIEEAEEFAMEDAE